MREKIDSEIVRAVIQEAQEMFEWGEKHHQCVICSHPVVVVKIRFVLNEYTNIYTYFICANEGCGYRWEQGVV